MSREAWAALRWHQSMVLFNELRLLEELRGAAPARKYESLARRALKTGQEGVAYVVVSILAQKYFDARQLRRHHSAAGQAEKLGDTRRPANLANTELEKRFGVALARPPDLQSDSVRETIAFEIYLTTFGPEARLRIRELQSLRERALSKGKHLEAALCDLFLVSEYRSSRNTRGEREVTEHLKSLEKRHKIRDHRGTALSESLSRNLKRRGTHRSSA